MKNRRPPIVTVLGHVDHGKTTLLDAIRKTNITSREAGGITQGIGASQVEYQGKKITFIDTPGHAAFSKMRSRGTRVADIAILVVSADDGVMPQTKEAISYIKESKTPLIVAITKTDLPSADPEMVKGSLEKEEIFLEGRGGDVPAVLVSAKKKQGLEDLLEIISLVAEVTGIGGTPNDPLEAVVIETSKDKRGPTVSAVIKKGTITVSDEVIASGIVAKVRGLFDQTGKGVSKVGPGEPCLVLGFSELPEVGSEINLKSMSDKPSSIKPNTQKVHVDPGKIVLVIKAKSRGTLDAIVGGLLEKATIIKAEVGNVAESDVFLAKSSSAEILVFAARVPSGVKRLADTEGFKVKSFEIIYELFDYIDESIKKTQDEILGKAEIIKTFSFDGAKRIAGCRVISGSFTKDRVLVLMRGENKVGNTKVISLKKAKSEVNEVKSGEEFGIYFEPQFDFAEGDMILSVRKSE